MLFAMPQLTAFLLATSYVLSGPALLARGEKMGAKVSVLHPAPVARPLDPNAQRTPDDSAGRTRELHEHRSDQS